LVLDPSGLTVAEADQTKRAAFAAADMALAASGTVSLELAATRTPTVIAYDMNWLSWQILSRMVKLSTVTLVNLVTGQNVVPEFLGPRCTPELISGELITLLSDPDRMNAQKQAMEACMQALGAGGEPPGRRAAQAILDRLPAT
jgi:lipid-A-disaccharide synthase